MRTALLLSGVAWCGSKEKFVAAFLAGSLVCGIAPWSWAQQEVRAPVVSLSAKQAITSAPRLLSYAEFSEQYDLLPPSPKQRVDFLLSQVDNPNEGVLERVAMYLGYFDDPRAIPALEKLTHHPPAPPRGDLMVPHVAGYAYDSLDKIKTRPLIARFERATTAVEMEAIIDECYRHHTERVEELEAILRSKVDKQPNVIVPILVRRFLGDFELVVVQYPSLTKPLLRPYFLKRDANQRTYIAADLARQLKAYEYIPLMVRYLSKDADGDDGGTWVQAQMMFIEYGDRSLPYLKKPLYSTDTTTRYHAMAVLGNINTPASLRMLSDFQKSLLVRIHALKTSQNSKTAQRERASLISSLENAKEIVTYARKHPKHRTKNRY